MHIFAPSGQLEPHRSIFSTRKRCLIGILIRGYQNFYSLSPKNWILGPKTAKFGPNWHFGPNIGIFGPFDLMPDQKTMQTSCRSGFLLCWYQNFYFLPYKLGFLAKKWPNLVQNLHFWSFWAKYCHLLHILSNARPKSNVNKVPRLVFCYVGNKTFDFSSKKKDFLPKIDQIWPKIGIFG